MKTFRSLTEKEQLNLLILFDNIDFGNEEEKEDALKELISIYNNTTNSDILRYIIVLSNRRINYNKDTEVFSIMGVPISGEYIRQNKNNCDSEINIKNDDLTEVKVTSPNLAYTGALPRKINNVINSSASLLWDDNDK